MYIAYTNGKFLYLPEDNVITYNPLSKHQQTLICYNSIVGGYYKHYKDTLSGHIISLYISAILVGQSELTVTINSNIVYHKAFVNLVYNTLIHTFLFTVIYKIVTYYLTLQTQMQKHL